MSRPDAYRTILTDSWYLVGAFAPILAGMLLGSWIDDQQKYDAEPGVALGLFVIVWFGFFWQFYWVCSGWPS